MCIASYRSHNGVFNERAITLSSTTYAHIFKHLQRKRKELFTRQSIKVVSIIIVEILIRLIEI